MKEPTEVDTVIIGAGVIGCAVASALSRKRPGSTIVVLEAGPRIAEGITSRNSGVIHAGIYYPPKSLKAQSCVRGNALLYEWAEKHKVSYKKLGKLIVAKDLAQVPVLEKTFEDAKASGAKELKKLSGAEVSAKEPGINMLAGIWSPFTGIIDQYALCRSLLDDAQSRGVHLLVDNEVKSIVATNGRYDIETGREFIRSESVINAAGLYTDEIARMAGVSKYMIYPWRGDYFTLRTPVRFNHLIYPVKDPGAAGLGVHLTIDIAGKYKLGPDVNVAKSKTDFAPAPEKLNAFLEAAKKIFGDAVPMNLEYDYCGIRPKLRAPHEKEEKDFIISEDLPGFVNLVGIESPGLTSSLDLAERAVGLLTS